MNDNFPNLTCENQNITLTYRGNKYDKLYFYPHANSTFYAKCASLISKNEGIPYSVKEPERQWSTHTCFKACHSPADCLLGFEDDQRQECDKNNRDKGIYCLLPETPCEKYVTAEEECPGGDSTMCINWGLVFLAIFIANTCQLVFEAAMLYSLEITYNATPLEKYRLRQLGEEY